MGTEGKREKYRAGKGKLSVRTMSSGVQRGRVVFDTYLEGLQFGTLLPDRVRCLSGSSADSSSKRGCKIQIYSRLARSDAILK